MEEATAADLMRRSVRLHLSSSTAAAASQNLEAITRHLRQEEEEEEVSSNKDRLVGAAAVRRPLPRSSILVLDVTTPSHTFTPNRDRYSTLVSVV